jgi:hypothetical protein
VFSANEDGRIYVHDSGFSEPTATGGIEMVVRSSDSYPAGVGLHAKLVNAWVHHQAAAGQTGEMTIIQRNSGEEDSEGKANIPLDYRESTPCGREGDGEAFQFEFSITNPSAQVTVDYFAADFEFAGRTEGK